MEINEKCNDTRTDQNFRGRFFKHNLFNFSALVYVLLCKFAFKKRHLNNVATIKQQLLDLVEASTCRNSSCNEFCCFVTPSSMQISNTKQRLAMKRTLEFTIKQTREVHSSHKYVLLRYVLINPTFMSKRAFALQRVVLL